MRLSNKKPDVLIINSYAGSLTVAAHALGLKVRGSYEDAGFGLRTQMLNFPDLMYREKEPWPKWENGMMSNTVVIAHPPCAAFSNQNNVADKRGLDTDAFKCHKAVMKYALSQGCRALAIESVMGALEAARGVHDRYAKKYGYNVFRILQNAVTFGVPQWRERFWVVFSKTPMLTLDYVPKYRPIEDIVQPTGTPPPGNSEMTQFYDRMAKAGYSHFRVNNEFLSGEYIGNFLSIARKVLDIDDPGPNHQVVREKLGLGGRFGSKMPRIVDPNLWATTVLSDSNFYYMGREFFVEEYLAIMGFPKTYKFHEKDIRQFKMYLSKGVCPPVAQWLLSNLTKDLKSSNLIIFPDQILDLRVKKADVEKQIRQRRLFDESNRT